MPDLTKLNLFVPLQLPLSPGRGRGLSPHNDPAGSRRRVFLAMQLISRPCRACSANQPIRLFQNVGICRLFSRKKADHHEGRAK